MTVWSRIAASVVKLPPPRTTAVSVERGLIAKMPDGVELVADRWYPTHPMAEGRAGDRAHPHALRAHGHGPARPALRGARLPGRRAELPGDVRVGGRVRPGAQRAGRRARHARMGRGAALVRRPPRHVGRELPRHDAVGRGAGRPRLRQGAQPPGHRGELPRLGRVPGGAFALETGLAWIHEITHQELGWRTVLRARLRGARAVSTSSAVLPSGNVTPPPSASPWPSTRTGSSTAPRVTRGGTGRLRAPAGEGAAGQLHRRLVRPLPQGAGGRLRGPPAGRAHGPLDHRALDAHQPRPVRRDRARRSAAGSTASSARTRASDRTRRCASSSWGRAPGASSRCGRRRGRPSGGISAAGGTLTPTPPNDDERRPRSVPLQPARSHAGRGRTVAQHDHGGAQGPAPP